MHSHHQEHPLLLWKYPIQQSDFTIAAGNSNYGTLENLKLNLPIAVDGEAGSNMSIHCLYNFHLTFTKSAKPALISWRYCNLSIKLWKHHSWSVYQIQIKIVRLTGIGVQWGIKALLVEGTITCPITEYNVIIWERLTQLALCTDNLMKKWNW